MTTEYQTLAEIARRELRWREMPSECRAVALTVLEWSFGKNRDFAVFATARMLARLSAVPETHLPSVLAELRAANVVVSDEAHRTFYFYAPTRASPWGFRRKRSSMGAEIMVAIMESGLAFDGQLDLLPREDREDRLERVIAEVARTTGIEQEHVRQEIMASLGLAGRPAPPTQRGEGELVNSEPKTYHVGKLTTVSRPPIHEHDLNNNIFISCSETGDGGVGEGGNREVSLARDQESGVRSQEPESEILFEAVLNVTAADHNSRYARVWKLRCAEMPAAVRAALAELKVRRENVRLGEVRSPGAWLNERYWRILNERAARGCAKSTELIRNQKAGVK